MENNWKNLILKSGLPLEYEVRECFAENECTVWEETTYLRSDEYFLEKEFSYDVHANTWINGHSVDFLVECKYKTESTKWFFLPHTTSYQYDLEYHDFLHPIDHFSKHSFYLNDYFIYSEKVWLSSIFKLFSAGANRSATKFGSR